MSAASPPRAKLVAALAVVYVVWGSTYLAIRFAIETIPPFTMAGARFLVAGVLLFAWTRWRREPAPRRTDLLHAIAGGALMMLFSNGLVTWSETRVDSALAAIVISCVPLWMLAADWIARRGERSRPLATTGVVLGIAGVVGLVWPTGGATRAIDPLGAAALLIASLSWTAGSLYARRVRPGPTPLTAAALQMLCGGALQLGAGVVLGELDELEPLRVSALSFASWMYLMLAGSLAGFTAYLWLLRHTSSALASSYAFVNPLVALALGVAFAGERLAPRALVATFVIVGAVVLVVLGREGRSRSTTGSSAARGRS